MNKSKAIILFSGGLDSVTALYWAIREKYTPIAINIDYFNSGYRERQAAKDIASLLKIKYIDVPLNFLKQADDLEYEGNKLINADSLPTVYIPHKNLLFTSIACYYAEVFQADIIIQGLLKIDFGKYPDNSFDYFQDLESLIQKGIPNNKNRRIKLEFPLKNLDKAGVIQMAFDLGVPLELTWSCYLDGIGPSLLPCGKCKGCLERVEGFKFLGVPDPLLSSLKKK